MNDENLIPNSKRTPKELREMTQKGGRNSGETRRRRKRLREIAEAYLDTAYKGKRGKTETNEDGEVLTNGDKIVMEQVKKATKGDTKAYDAILRTTGEYQVNVKGDIDINATVLAMTPQDAYTYLYRPFSMTYQQFFYDNRESRHVLLQGGRRSGKTQATIRHLLRLTEATEGVQKIMVVCYQYPQLQKTIEDWQSITGQAVKADKAETRGAEWQFCNFDDYTKAQGSQCDYLFINEAVNLPEDIADVLVLGTRMQCFYNYNPTKSSWVQKLIAPEHTNLLCTTFKDNEYLPAEQVAEFEKIRERALKPNSSMHDRYMYEVYYKGNFATMVGQVFGCLERCTADEYENIPAKELYGLDFGFATDGDPTVLVGVKVYEHKAYCRQYIYQQGIVKMSDLAARMTKAGFNRHCRIFGDYGGQGRGRMDELIRMGWSIHNAIKTERIDGLSQLLSLDAIVLCDGGDEMRAEFEGLELKPPTATGRQDTKGADHAIDAVRYAFQAAKYYA